MASCWTLSKPPQCSHQAIAHKDIRLTTTLNELFMNKPTVFKPKPGHALITWTKVNLSGIIPSRCICWKSCITSSSCPSFHKFCKLPIPWKNIQLHSVPGAIAAISAANHGRFHWPSSQSASCVFLCLKSRYLSFVYNQKCRSSWPAYCIYLPSPAYDYYPTSAKDLKRISANLDQGRMASKRDHCHSSCSHSSWMQHLPISWRYNSKLNVISP